MKVNMWSRRKPKTPAKLYHGTSSKNITGIEKTGLVPKKPCVKKWGKCVRKLGSNVSFADLTSAVCWAKKDVKYRGGKPIVLELNTAKSAVKAKFLGYSTVPCKHEKRRLHHEFGAKKTIPFKALKVIDVEKKCKLAKLKGTSKKSPYC